MGQWKSSHHIKIHQGQSDSDSERESAAPKEPSLQHQNTNYTSPKLAQLCPYDLLLGSLTFASSFHLVKPAAGMKKKSQCYLRCNKSIYWCQLFKILFTKPPLKTDSDGLDRKVRGEKGRGNKDHLVDEWTIMRKDVTVQSRSQCAGHNNSGSTKPGMPERVCHFHKSVINDLERCILLSHAILY